MKRLSARNTLEVSITQIKECVANTEISAKIADCKLSAIITKDSCDEMGLKVGDSINFIIKAQNVLVAMPDFNAKISVENILKVSIDEIKVGAVMSQISASFGDYKLCAVITSQSCQNLGLKVGDEILFLINANDILIAKN